MIKQTKQYRTNMKTMKYFRISLMTGCIALMASCSDLVASRMGDYSYNIAKSEVVIDDSVHITLPAERGAMLMEQKDGNNIILTINNLAGDTYTTTGELQDDKIILKPFTRIINVVYKDTVTEVFLPVEKTFNEDYNLEVSGEADVYSESIHFTLQYSGKCISNGKKMIGSNILMIAKKN